MINKIKSISSNTCYPYFNQALEKFLLDNLAKDSLVLFTWQNEHAYLYGIDHRLEEPLSDFEQADLYPLRRMSPDQDYKQDSRELNFAFLVQEEDLDTDRFLAIVKSGLIQADIAVDQLEKDLGRMGSHLIESSGYQTGSRYCFHGRIRLGYCPEADLEEVRSRLFASLEESYGLKAASFDKEELNEAILNTYIKFFASESWLEHGQM